MLHVNTNISSINAQRKLNNSTRSLGVSLERLSSGLRVNGAKDDAAGLAIDTRMTAQTRGLQKSIQNGTDWISLLQTADGAFNEMSNILQRVRELSVQSVNDTNNDRDRASLNAEVGQLIEEMDRITKTTEFNGLSILDGEITNSYMQLGSSAGEDEAFSIKKLDTHNLGRGFYDGPKVTNGVDATVGFNDLTLRVNGEFYKIRDTVAADDTLSTSLAQNSVIAKAAAINSSSDLTGVVMKITGTKFTTTAGINAVTLDTDTYIELNNVKISGFAVQTADADQALKDAINAVSEQTGVVASNDAGGTLTLFAADGRNIEFGVHGIGSDFAGQADNSTFVRGGGFKVHTRNSFSFANNTVAGIGNDTALGGNSSNPTVNVFVDAETTVHSYDISTRENAVRTLDIIEFAFSDLIDERAKLGAQQNRLESTIANLQVTNENLSAAKSRIVDADFAKETADLARNQILQQAGVSVLSQANQSLSIALSLLF